ncbi:MAG: DNA damage-inducible protein D [Chitinophagales bacterium]|nr:DNA damage-inducible protein D [Chitinophagales bacterium]
MKKELIVRLFKSFEEATLQKDGVDFWLARDLQEMLGYSQWRNFSKVIEKAKNACENSDLNPDDHFIEVSRDIVMPKTAVKQIDDLMLTRYACYLIAQNGDPTKSEIAFAQTYFAIQTRKQEIIEQRLLDIARVSAREKLTKSEKKLSGILYERDVDEKGFAIIRSKGDKALFGGFTTNDMKQKLGVPATRPLADFLPTLTIKAKDFATELTSHNVQEKELRGETSITKEHIENNEAVRKMLKERGVQPEQLPPAEDVMKVKRKLESDEKKMLKKIKKESGKK